MATLVSPMSPVIKRSTRKRQRPTFFAEEIEATVATSSTKKHHSSSGSRSSRQRHSLHHIATTTTHSQQLNHPPPRRARSDLSELQETVSGLRQQIETATVQMQELRSLVTMLADLYRGEQDAPEEAPIFTPTSSEHGTNDESDVFSSTASEQDEFGQDAYEEEDFFSTPLSPLL